MENKPIITSKFSSEIVLVTLFAILLIVAFAVLTYFSITPEGIDGIYLGPIAIIILFLLFIAYGFLRLKRIEVYDSYIVFKRFLGLKKEKVYLSDITHWGEIRKGGRETNYGIIRRLILYTSNKRYIIRADEYNNYYLLKKTITAGKLNNSFQSQTKHEKKLFAAFLIIVTVIIALLWKSYFSNLNVPNDAGVIAETEMVIIKDILAESPKIENEGGRSRTHYLILKLKAYPENIFEIRQTAYDATYVTDFINNVYVGDSISISVLKKDIPFHNSKTDTTKSIWKSEPTYPVWIYGLSILKFGEEYVYLSLEDYNQTIIEGNKSNKTFWFYFALFITVAFAAMIVVMFRDLKKEHAKHLAELNEETDNHL